MTMNQGFAKVLVEDYASLGWGTPVNEYTLKGSSGVELEFAIVGDDEGNTDAVELYENGDLIYTFAYEDEAFAQKLALTVNNILEPSYSHE